MLLLPPFFSMLRLIQVFSKRNIATEIQNVKRGNFVKVKGSIYNVVSSSHRVMGRSGAHFKLEMIDVNSKAKIFERFNSGSDVDVISLDPKKLKVMYVDSEIHLIDDEFNQYSFPLSKLDVDSTPEKFTPFLTDGMELTVEMFENDAIMIRLPAQETYTVNFLLNIDCTNNASNKIRW